MSRPFVTFLSDFGLADDFVGVCHGVIGRICPEAQVIDVTHGIRPQAVGQGARVLAGAIRYLPVGVHLAVVDPGVGSERRAIALRSDSSDTLGSNDDSNCTPPVGGSITAFSDCEQRSGESEQAHENNR